MKLGKKKKGKVDLMSKMAAETGCRASGPEESHAPACRYDSHPSLCWKVKINYLCRRKAPEAFDLKGTNSTANMTSLLLVD